MASQYGKSTGQPTDTVEDFAGRVGGTIERTAEAAANNAVDAADAVRQYASDGFDRVELAVRKNPLAAAAIAAGVGFVLAALARR